jgi:hypothetical protein
MSPVAPPLPPPPHSPQAAQPRDPVRSTIAWVSTLIGVAYLVALITQALISRTTGVFVNLIGGAFVFGVVAATAGCALVAIGAGARPRTRRDVVFAGVMGALAGFAPIAIVVFMRLSAHTCTVVNVLGLPWAEPWREIAHVTAGLIWLASTVLLIVAVNRPRLRRAGVLMWKWSGIIAVPTMLLFFFMVYGDPIAGCTPT